MKAMLFLTATLAMTAVAAPVAAKDDHSGKDAKEKLICKTDGATGSRIRKNRVCKTEEEWREFYANTKKNVDEYTSKQSGYAPPGQNPLGGS
ncbi:hypothetical protein [Croceibacterium aestuarii]|uniref:hypothetical protein n=1 Tax=Croceibacterium aestuarii TaxID=3064139 RepID=UPI00272E17BE|nr:hypothetical protein [Croceibacterium sp. D39]